MDEKEMMEAQRAAEKAEREAYDARERARFHELVEPFLAPLRDYLAEATAHQRRQVEILESMAATMAEAVKGAPLASPTPTTPQPKRAVSYSRPSPSSKVR